MLEIEVQKTPQSAERIKAETVTLIETVLSGLDYDGKWLLRFVQKVKNRSDRIFSVVRRQGTGILIKTKPKEQRKLLGDNFIPPARHSSPVRF